MTNLFLYMYFVQKWNRVVRNSNSNTRSLQTLDFSLFKFLRQVWNENLIWFYTIWNNLKYDFHFQTKEMMNYSK